MAEPSHELRNLFRLIAIEVLLTETLAIRYLGTPDPVAAAAVHREHMRQIWSQVAAPFLRNAADSELAVGEIGDVIDELIEHAAQTAARIAVSDESAEYLPADRLHNAVVELSARGASLIRHLRILLWWLSP